MPLSLDKFLCRFLLHILPQGFVRNSRSEPFMQVFTGTALIKLIVGSG